eukprot:29473-Pelagococcus_subviridis.AAC.3
MALGERRRFLNDVASPSQNCDPPGGCPLPVDLPVLPSAWLIHPGLHARPTAVAEAFPDRCTNVTEHRTLSRSLSERRSRTLMTLAASPPAILNRRNFIFTPRNLVGGGNVPLTTTGKGAGASRPTSHGKGK